MVEYKVKCPNCNKKFKTQADNDEDLTTIMCFDCWTKQLVYGDPNHGRKKTKRGNTL